MKPQNPMVLLVICAVIIVFSILGLATAFLTPIAGSLDGLLMLSVCLIMAVIFVLLLVVLAKEQGWLGKHDKTDTAAPPATAAK